MKYPSGDRNAVCDGVKVEEDEMKRKWCSDTTEEQQNNSIYILFIY